MTNGNKIAVVFVLSAPRSGSTWLSTVLGSNSWAKSLGEYCRPFTRPGHFTCTMCEADGLSECTVLHGISDVRPRDAFDFAARRLSSLVLIDSSKSLDWSRSFLFRDDIEARLIHLVRNPCGFVESQGRRQAQLSHDELLGSWEATNRKIEEFSAASGSPCLLACYDDLADDPNSHFPRLCDFIGFAWEPDAINYWLVPHHGLAGNGASSLYLRNRQRTVYLTGDDDFYAGLAQQRSFADRRWVDRLPFAFCRKAIETPYARHLQKLAGSNWQRLLGSDPKQAI